MFHVALTRPWRILIDPISFAVAVYLAVVYALLYMLFTIYPIVFQQKRGWNSGVGELPLLGTAIGAVIGGGIIFANTARDRKKAESGHKGVPEDRLPVAMLGGIMFPITDVLVCLDWRVQQCTLDLSYSGWSLPLDFHPAHLCGLSQLSDRHVSHVRCERIGSKHRRALSRWSCRSLVHPVHV